MDPEANMREQLELSREISTALEGDPDDGIQNEELTLIAIYAGRLAELVIALDEWKRRGGCC